jgi:hypothetical protein
MRPIGAGLAVLLAVFTLLVVTLAPSIARAEAPSARATPVHVLGLDSDDSEDQAEALTGALRSRVRLAPGLSLQETQHSLGMLTAALRCPPLPQRPDAACTQRIGDQLHTDRFVWGIVSKAGGGQVTAEVHLWARGKPDAMAKESYSDNLKDANDEVLRKIAARILDRITGAFAMGTITVRAGEAEGAVWINGQRKQTLEKGAATIELPAGTYALEVRATGYAPAQQASVVVNGGQDTPIAVKLTPEETQVSASASSHPANARRIVAWSAIGVGAAAIVGGSIEGLRFLSLKSDLDADRNKIDRTIVDVCAVQGDPNAADACTKFNDAKSARTVGLVLGSVGVVAAVVGVVLLVTDPGQAAASDQQPAAPQTALRIAPWVSPSGAGLVGTF